MGESKFLLNGRHEGRKDDTGDKPEKKEPRQQNRHGDIGPKRFRRRTLVCIWTYPIGTPIIYPKVGINLI